MYCHARGSDSRFWITVTGPRRDAETLAACLDTFADTGVRDSG
jgi:hypothetical protein